LAAITSRVRNQIATKPSQHFGTPTVEYPQGGDMRKCASAKEFATKKRKMTVCLFGFTEKVCGLPFTTTPQQHNTSFAKGRLPLLVYTYMYIYICCSLGC